MSIEWFRDLSISILGLGVTIVVIFIGVLALLVYRKVRPILDSIKATTKTIENISSSVEEEVSKPLAKLAAVIQGVRQAVSFVGKFSRGKEGGKDE
jgi:uncharacterized protein YoxC